MTMKKTIAAIAAGAVAVSAMATTVSALEAKTLTYNLVKTVKLSTSEGKITANFDSLTLGTGDKVYIAALGTGDAFNVVSFEISGSYWDDEAGANKSFNRIFASEDAGEEGYSIEGSKLMNWIWNSTTERTERGVIIPVKAKTTGTNTSLVTSSQANIKVVAKYKALPAGVDSVKALNEKIGNGYGIVLNIVTADAAEAVKPTVAVHAQSPLNVTVPDDAATATYTYSATPAGTASAVPTPATGSALNVTGEYAGTESGEYTYTAQGWTKDGMTAVIGFPGLTITGAQAASDAVLGTVGAPTKASGLTGVTAVGGTLNTTKAIEADLMKGDGKAETVTFTYTDAESSWDNDPTEYGVTVTGSPSADGTITVSIGAGQEAKAADKLTVTAATEATGAWSPALPAGVTVTGEPVDGDNFTVTAGSAATGTAYSYTSPVTGSASDVKGAGELKYPFKTTLTGSDNVLDSIYKLYNFSDVGDTKVSDKENRIAITAVINDAIVNYSDVMFVFNTGIKPVVTDDSWTNAGPVGTYCENTWDAAGVLDVTQFGRHFWDEATGYDPNTIYISNDWLGNNLFSGALIINKNLTLSLGATDKFDWTGTSLSFSWDAIQDAALTTNGYANYVTDMVLRTSSDWYWDNFQVVLGATEDEDVGTTSPVEAEEEELEESEPEVEAEPEEEPEEEPEVEAEPEPEVAPAANPGTGNAPVALAVIPVALAAAAIVAKKRG